MSNRDDTDTDRQKMSEASHTNPYTNESFGETVTYTRGRIVAADGGRANAAEEDTETIADMDHTPRRGAPDTNRVYQRGEVEEEE